jgi:hypothetical protein
MVWCDRVRGVIHAPERRFLYARPDAPPLFAIRSSSADRMPAIRRGTAREGSYGSRFERKTYQLARLRSQFRRT